MIFPMIYAHAQINSIRLFPVSNEKALVAWKLTDKSDQYIGQFVLNTGEKDGENFAIYGNDLTVFNSSGEFMVVRSKSDQGSEISQGITNYQGRIYYSTENYSDDFRLSSHYWPTCGVGALDFEQQLKSYGDNFLYTFQNEGYLASYQINHSGEMSTVFEVDLNTYHISMDILPDSTCLFVWFNIRRWEEENDFPIGIYASSMKNGKTLQDSVIIKEYPDSLIEEISWDPWSVVPHLRLATLNDSTFQLFIISRDSSSLLTYLLDRNALIKGMNDYPIPGLSEHLEKKISYINAFNISNFFENSRAIFITAEVLEHDHTKTENYLYNFNNQGGLIGTPLIDTTHVFKRDCFSYKTGEATFLNTSVVDSEARIDTYENFTKLSSKKLGLVSAIEERKAARPEAFQLGQNYPNPFNPSTTINFHIEKSGQYTLSVYNTVGQLVREVFSKNLLAKEYSIHFEAGNLSSGAYFYQLSGEGYRSMQKFLILK